MTMKITIKEYLRLKAAEKLSMAQAQTIAEQKEKAKE